MLEGREDRAAGVPGARALSAVHEFRLLRQALRSGVFAPLSRPSGAIWIYRRHFAFLRTNRSLFSLRLLANFLAFFRCFFFLFRYWCAAWQCRGFGREADLNSLYVFFFLFRYWCAACQCRGFPAPSVPTALPRGASTTRGHRAVVNSTSTDHVFKKVHQHATMRHCLRVSGVFSNNPFPRRTW